MKLTANLLKVYKERFKEILLPLGFKLKGSLFLRAINEEIIQTVSTFKNSPIDFSLNIGIIPFSLGIEKSSLKEGNYRLYDFVGIDSGEFNYNPLNLKNIEEVMEECVIQFKKGVLPIFESIQTEEDYLIYKKNLETKTYGEIIYICSEKLYINLRLRNYTEVIKVVEAFWEQNVSAITSNHYDHNLYGFKTDEEFEIFLKGELQEWVDIITAITDNNTDYLDCLVENNQKDTMAILKGYGYSF